MADRCCSALVKIPQYDEMVIDLEAFITARMGHGAEFERAERFGPARGAGEPLEGAVSIAASGTSVCVSLDDGTVWCWGSNEDGHLANGSTSEAPQWWPEPVMGLSDIEEVFAFASDLGVLAPNICAREAGRAPYCWGGRVLERGSTEATTEPVMIEGFSSFTSLAGSCVLGTDTIIRCRAFQPGPPLVRDTPDDIAALLADGLVRLTDGSVVPLPADRTFGVPSADVLAALHGAEAIISVSRELCALIDGEVRCTANLNGGELELIDLPSPARLRHLGRPNDLLFRKQQRW